MDQIPDIAKFADDADLIDVPTTMRIELDFSAKHAERDDIDLAGESCYRLYLFPTQFAHGFLAEKPQVIRIERE